MPGAVFSLTSLTGAGNSRYARWTAVSKLGQVLDGDDSFGILNGRILYHSALFTVTPAATAVPA